MHQQFHLNTTRDYVDSDIPKIDSLNCLCTEYEMKPH